MSPEMNFETLAAGDYEDLQEPILIASHDVDQVEDFRVQQDLGGISFLRLPVEGWESYMGQGKVLLLFPGALEDDEIREAVMKWVDSEEWTFSVPPEHYEQAEVEREQCAAEMRHRQCHAKWWRRAGVAFGVICGLLCWSSTQVEGAGLAVLPWFVAALGWIASAVTAGE